jgi:hypothetical protein
MTQFLRVRDERLNTSDIRDAKYIVKEGPRTSYTVLPPQNVNTGNLVYQLNNVGPNVGRNRQIWVNPQCTVVLTGTGLNALTAQGQLALKAWPFNRCVGQIQHTLNGATESYLSNQIIDFLARLKTGAQCMQPYDNTQPDNATDYTTGTANISPLNNYTSTILGDVQHPRNIGIVSAVASAGNTVLTVTLNWWEPLITPFSAIGDNAKNLPAVYAIDGETINVVFANALSDLLAYNPTSVTVSSTVVTLNSCTMFLEYITARDLVLPEVSLYQFPKYQRFQSQITSGTLPPTTPSPGMAPSSITVQINAQTMPSKIICFIRCPEGLRTASTPDCYASITALQVQLDNGTTLLNGASQRKLYDISVQNGLTDVYGVFAQYNLSNIPANPYYGAGSVVILDPAKDLSISQEEGLSNCSAGKYTIQITMNYTNAQPIAGATAYAFVVNDAVLVRQGRSYVSKLLAYSKEEIINAQRDARFVELEEYEEARQNNLFLSGGSFKSFFKRHWDNRHNYINSAKQAYALGKQAYDAGKQAHSLYKSLKNPSGGVAEYGNMGGVAEFGGMDDMKMYYS